MTRAFLVLITIAASAHAQRSTFRSETSGLYVGVHMDANRLAAEGKVVGGGAKSVESGVGASVLVGYGSNARWSLFAGASRASLESVYGGSYHLTNIDAGARLNLRSGFHSLVPFAELAASVAGVSDSHGTSRGLAGMFGVGLNAHATPNVAVSATALLSVGGFDSFSVAGHDAWYGNTTSTTRRLQLGVLWFPVSTR